ncbi:hypothetical protein GYH30_032690 [Glycine max]|nr:hypothetical protein GYH30_032690 [Glycine max]
MSSTSTPPSIATTTPLPQFLPPATRLQASWLYTLCNSGMRDVAKGGEEHVEVRVCEGVVDVRNVEFNGTKD